MDLTDVTRRVQNNTMLNCRKITKIGSVIFTALRYASAVCRRQLVMCLSVCLSHFGIVSKQLNVGSRK